MTHPLIEHIVTEGGHTLPPGTDTWGIKSVRADLTTHNGFQWPFPGGVADQSEGWDPTNSGAYPARLGDGVCTALTWGGMASGSFPARTLLLTAHDSATARGTPVKVRAPRIHVVALVDGERLLREHGAGQDLRGAHLTGTDLRGADLTGADLTGADLTYANLTWADLTGADLTYANLTWADLRGAHLTRATLTGATLTGARLTGARLTWADLTWADLRGADLTRAHLRGTDLARAFADGGTIWPDGFNPETAGVTP